MPSGNSMYSEHSGRRLYQLCYNARSRLQANPNWQCKAPSHTSCTSHM